MATLEIEPSDVIRLIEQYLKENNLLKSLQCLQEEACVSLNTVDSVDTFVNDINSGHWDVVLKVVKLLKLPDSKLIDLYEQIAIELIELKETRAANWLIHKTEPMLKLKSTSPDRYLHLQKLLEPSHYAKPYRDSTKERRRAAIAEALKKEVSVVPSQRLLSLLGDALKWQKHENSLPSNTSIDIFTGKPRMVKAEKETHPNVMFKHCIKPLKNTGDLGLVFVCCAEFSPDGHYLAVGYSTGLVELRHATNGRFAHDLKYQADKNYIVTPSKTAALSLCFDDKFDDLLAVGDKSGYVSIWKISTGQLYQTFESHHRNKSVNCVLFSRTTKAILSAGQDKNVRFHRIASKTEINCYEHKHSVNSLTWSRDEKHFIATSDRHFIVWDTLSRNQPLRYISRDSKIHTIFLMPHSTEDLFILCESKCIEFMNISGVDRGKLGDDLYLDEEDSEIMDQKSSDEQISVQKKKPHFYAACVSPKANWIYMVDSKHIYCFNYITKTMKKRLLALEDSVNDLIGVKHHPFLNLLITYDNCGNLKLWRP